jgi:glycerophosphoryl diester phosphodiesterase
VTPIIRRMSPTIVAHRGDAEHFPENTLPAFEAAWRGGLRHVELDVQVSADGVPYVIHDAALDRTTNATGDLRLMHAGQLDGIDAGEPARFGRRHAGTPLPRLSSALALMEDFPASQAFVEVKRASLVHHGHARCMEKVLAALAPAAGRCIVISFDAEACRIARAAGVPVGWVVHGDSAERLTTLEALAPDYAFCDHRELPATGALPTGPWRWVIYEVVDAPLALELASRGAAMIESMAPLRLAAALAAGERARA